MFQRGTLQSRLSAMAPNLFSDKNDTGKYARNLLKVEIFYEELYTRVVTETPAYTVQSYCKDVMILWLRKPLMCTRLTHISTFV